MAKDPTTEVELTPAQAALAASNQTAEASGHHAPPKKAPLFSAARSPSRYPFKELIKLCRGMAAMLKANINTSDAIKYYMTGHPNPFVRETLAIVRSHLETGLPVYTAFAKTKKFDNKFISLIRAGADTGQLDGAFHSIAHRLKKEAEFKAKMRKATLLPAFIMLALIGLFIVASVKNCASGRRHDPGSGTGARYALRILFQDFTHHSEPMGIRCRWNHWRRLRLHLLREDAKPRRRFYDVEMENASKTHHGNETASLPWIHGNASL